MILKVINIFMTLYERMRLNGTVKSINVSIVIYLFTKLALENIVDDVQKYFYLFAPMFF